MESERLFHSLGEKYRQDLSPCLVVCTLGRFRMFCPRKLSDEFLSCIRSRKQGELGLFIVLKIEPAILYTRCSASVDRPRACRRYLQGVLLSLNTKRIALSLTVSSFVAEVLLQKCHDSAQ